MSQYKNVGYVSIFSFRINLELVIISALTYNTYVYEESAYYDDRISSHIKNRHDL